MAILSGKEFDKLAMRLAHDRVPDPGSHHWDVSVTALNPGADRRAIYQGDCERVRRDMLGLGPKYLDSLDENLDGGAS